MKLDCVKAILSPGANFVGARTIYAEQYIYEDHPYKLISLFIQFVMTVFVEKLLALMKTAETAEKVKFIIILRFK